MEAHNCLSCGILISSYLTRCYECRRIAAMSRAYPLNGSQMPLEARSVPSLPPGNPMDILGYNRQF